jgi:hypothetical protein
VGRDKEALRRYRRRIDANVEHQRDATHVLNSLQDKVCLFAVCPPESIKVSGFKLSKYRKHIHDLESGLGVPKGELPSLVDSGFLGAGDVSDWSRLGVGGDANANYETVITRLDEERRRFFFSFSR